MKSTVQAVVSGPVADLVDEPPVIRTADGPALLGSGCRACGARAIGRRIVCSRCVSQEVDNVPLARRGTLYSFTTVHVGEPRVLGYVDLEDGVRTLADIVAGPLPLTPDAPVEFVVDGDAWFFRLIDANLDNPKGSGK